MPQHKDKPHCGKRSTAAPEQQHHRERQMRRQTVEDQRLDPRADHNPQRRMPGDNRKQSNILQRSIESTSEDTSDNRKSGLQRPRAYLQRDTSSTLFCSSSSSIMRWRANLNVNNWHNRQPRLRAYNLPTRQQVRVRMPPAAEPAEPSQQEAGCQLRALKLSTMAAQEPEPASVQDAEAQPEPPKKPPQAPVKLGTARNRKPETATVRSVERSAQAEAEVRQRSAQAQAKLGRRLAQAGEAVGQHSAQAAAEVRQHWAQAAAEVRQRFAEAVEGIAQRSAQAEAIARQRQQPDRPNLPQGRVPAGYHLASCPHFRGNRLICPCGAEVATSVRPNTPARTLRCNPLQRLLGCGQFLSSTVVYICMAILSGFLIVHIGLITLGQPVEVKHKWRSCPFCK
ncbi:uncharacterized protein DMAD_00722 [Drosophila madeirensis]|uniref:LITAF domain-containing protein n=1 Tax=Drosophila madeirensis TaxID=30013 RepID=A0AAU9FZC5_DROMD